MPRFAVEYLLYHEMLHLKHPVKLRGSRRCVHSAEFQAEEDLFPQLEAAKAFPEAFVMRVGEVGYHALPQFGARSAKRSLLFLPRVIRHPRL